MPSTPPQPYRPRRVPLHYSDVRDLTLGDVVDRARRNGHFVAIVAVVLAVALFFPGGTPISRSLLPSGSADGGGGQAAEVAGEQLAAGDGAVPSGASGSSFGDSPSDPDGFPFSPSPHGGDRGGRTGGSTGGGSQPPPEPAPSCARDEQFPEPVLGPTLDQARAAQAAIEGGIGRPFPVDLVGTVAAALCGDGSASGADLTADTLVLGRFARDAATPVLTALAPVVTDACGEIRTVALVQALATHRVAPSIVDALALCDRVAAATPPDASEGAVPDAPVIAPGAPATPAVDAPAPAPVEVGATWSSPAVFR